MHDSTHQYTRSTFLREGGRGWVYLSFLKSWPSPLAQQKKRMTLHRRLPENVWPYPSPLNPPWYYRLLQTACLRIATHCHNTVAKCWISLSQCHKTNLKCCAGNSLNKYYILYFCQEPHICQFEFWKKMPWRWLTCQLVLRVSCPNWERFVRNLQWKMCMWWIMEWGTHV